MPMVEDSDIEFDDTTIGWSFGEHRKRRRVANTSHTKIVTKSATAFQEDADKEDSRLIRDIKLISNNNKLSPGVYRSPEISSPYRGTSEQTLRGMGSPIQRPEHHKNTPRGGDIEMEPSDNEDEQSQFNGGDEDAFEPPRALAFPRLRDLDGPIDENISKESMIQSIDRTLDEVFGSVQHKDDGIRRRGEQSEVGEPSLAHTLPRFQDVLTGTIVGEGDDVDEVDVDEVDSDDDDDDDDDDDADFALKTLEKLKTMSSVKTHSEQTTKIPSPKLDISRETEASVRKNASTSSPLRNILASARPQVTPISKTNIPSLQASNQIKDWEKERWSRLETLIKSGLSDEELKDLAQPIFKTTTADLQVRIQFMRYYVEHENTICGRKTRRPQ